MNRLLEKKRDLGELQDKILAVQSKAEAEKRSLNKDEYTEINGLLDQVEVLEKDIETEERMLRVAGRVTASDPVQSSGPVHSGREFSSMGEFLQAVILAGMPAGEAIAGKRGGIVDNRLIEARATGLSEGVPAEGGFLLTQDFADELIKRTYQTGKLIPACRKFSLSKRSNSIKIPMVDETSRANGSRWGGIQVYSADEAAEKTASKPKWGVLELTLNKIVGLCYLTDELIEDVSFLEQWVSAGFSEEYGFKIDDYIFNGDGAGKPLGVMQSGALVTVAKETGQAAKTILAENVEKMYSRMWVDSVGKGVWAINQDCWPQIFQLHHVIGTGGVPMFVPSGGIVSAPFGALLGRPILPIEQAETLGTVGDIVFMDLSQYILMDKGGLQQASSIHVRFVYDEMVLRFVYRLDGQPMWDTPLTPYKGSATTSPFVALATRA